MSARVFLDTNVLVYAYAGYEPVKQAQALAVLQSPDAWLSTQVLIEFANVYHRKLKIAWPDVETAIQELIRDFNIYLAKSATIAHATRLAHRYGFSWFDALIVAATLECGCETLYSEDLNAGQLIEGTLQVVNPFAV
jgi:predicted nucleic acid-binding protein